MDAEADTESLSLDWVSEEELLPPSDTVGIGVGLDAMEAQAERSSTVKLTIKSVFVNRVLRLCSPAPVLTYGVSIGSLRSARAVIIFFILKLRLSVGIAVFGDDTVL